MTAASVASVQPPLVSDGEETKGEEETLIVNVSTYKPRRIPTPTWQECIKKIWRLTRFSVPIARPR